MNIDYAKTIPMLKILDKIGLKAVQENAPLHIYPSMFYTDARPTLHVNAESNTWFDSNEGIGGNNIEFLKEYLKRQDLHCSHVDAVDWLIANIGYPSLLDGISLPDQKEQNGNLKFRYKAVLTSTGLIRYVEKHCIPFAMARKHFKEVAYTKGKKGREVYALGLKTAQGSYAIHSPCISGFIGEPGITIIRPNKKDKPASFRETGKPQAIHVFKDSFDYLTVLRIDKNLLSDSEIVILNDYSLLNESANYIRRFGFASVCTWFDNEEVGKQATNNYAFMCSTQDGIQHKPQNYRYASGRDVNAHFISIAEGR